MMKRENNRLNQLLMNYNSQKISSPAKIPGELKQKANEIETPINKSGGFDKFDKENLKQIILNQQSNIANLKKKEAKMIRLLYAIKRQGLDIERIYNEEVKGVYDTPNVEEYDIPTINKTKTKGGKHQSNKG